MAPPSDRRKGEKPNFPIKLEGACPLGIKHAPPGQVSVIECRKCKCIKQGMSDQDMAVVLGEYAFNG